MNWLVFSYSIPGKSSSSPRVALWRRLRRVGAISPAGGVYVLPARDDCAEALQWLAQEIREAKGEALIMRVEQFESLPDAQLVALFNQARQEEYAEIGVEITAWQKSAKTKSHSDLQDALEKLRKRHDEIARVDYFDCPEGAAVAARLAELAQSLTPHRNVAAQISPAQIKDYEAKSWVTRPRPHVDRLSCAWLIRRFINPNATIRYSLNPRTDEVAFDMDAGEFGHRGNLCTFETMRIAFQLDDPGLRALGEIVHEIDLRDGRYAHPAAPGVDAILDGWRLADLADAEMETRGMAMFEGLYTHFLLTRVEPKRVKRIELKRKRGVS